MPHAGGEPGLGDAGSGATPVGNTFGSAAPGTAEASSARCWTSRRGGGESELGPIAAGRVRQVRSALRLAQEGREAAKEMVRTSCVAANGVFQRHENRTLLCPNVAGAEISPGPGPRVCSRVAGSGQCADGKTGKLRDRQVRPE